MELTIKREEDAFHLRADYEISTGFAHFDRHLSGGFRRGELLTIGSPTGRGFSRIDSMMRDDQGLHWIPLEMDFSRIEQRILAFEQQTMERLQTQTRRLAQKSGAAQTATFNLLYGWGARRPGKSTMHAVMRRPASLGYTSIYSPRVTRLNALQGFDHRPVQALYSHEAFNAYTQL